MNMKGSVAAAPLAIVDGTYLCLLPSPLSNSGAAGNNDEEEDVLHNVPAFPCIEVWKHCGPNTVDVTEMTTLMHLDDDDDEDEEPHGNNDDTLSKMTTIPIRLSDVSRYDFRFVHPVNVITLRGSSSVVQISSCCQNNISAEDRIAWSKDNSNRLDVNLPCMACDDEGEHDFECFEDDDECIDVYGDTSCIELDSSQKIQNRKQFSSSSFQVHGGGCCLIADFTGVGGYEQALILPPVESSLIVEDASLNSSNDESVLTQRKHMLQTMLENSILTDGSTAFLPRNAKVDITTDPMDSAIFKLTPVNREVLSRCFSKQNAAALQSKNMNVDNKTHDDHTKVNDNLSKDDTIRTSVPPKVPAWLEAIEQTIESRLAKQNVKANQLERTSQVRSDLITKGRETIHKAARYNSNGGSVDMPNDPQILRLRYGARPRTFSDTQHGLSAVIDLEIDIYLPSKREPEELYDFHVSCTLASRAEQNVENIRTQSGVVPVFQNGNCITILASVSLNDLDIDIQSNRKSTSTLDFNIQGLWLDKFQKRQGSVLCILRLPLSGILFSAVSSATRWGHCIQHEIDFTSINDEIYASTLSPSAVFDYRYPRTLNIDISESIGLQGGNIWKDLVSKLNSQIGMSSYVDLYFVKGEPTLKLVIFASNPAEQTAITNLVLQNLPENTKLFEQDPNEAKNVKVLLVSLKKEAETFQKHRTMPKGTVTSEMRKEMSSLQASSDGIASTIKRGWV